MKHRNLSREEIHSIESIFMQKYRDKNMRKASMPQLWFEIISDFLSYKYAGAEIVLRSVRERENKVLQHPQLSKEYISCLMTLMGVNNMVELSEEQKLVYLMMASSDERDEALKLVAS